MFPPTPPATGRNPEEPCVKSTYDIPYIHQYLEKVPLMSYLPISSTFGKFKKGEENLSAKAQEIESSQL